MYYFYILKCKDGTLYCGSAKNLRHRELTHNLGKGSKYVRSRGGGKIIYSEKFRALSKVLKREAEVKGWSREEKMRLIKYKHNKRSLGSPSEASEPLGTTAKFFTKQSKNFATIFDMDGVVAHSMPFHIRAWVEFARRRGFKVNKKLVLEHFNGRVNSEILEYLFKRKLSKAQLDKYIREKEGLYRKIYRPHVKPVKGLLKFLRKLKVAGIKIALATAAPPENVKFILKATETEKYFTSIINASNIKLGKPNPEIFFKATKKMRVSPESCIVFEDALNGIEAAKRAKMKVVAVATTHPAKDLQRADMVIKDFSQTGIEKCLKLLK